MVTHNWSNLFHHLVAGIFADALGKEYYAGVAKLCVNQLQPLPTCYCTMPLMAAMAAMAAMGFSLFGVSSSATQALLKCSCTLMDAKNWKIQYRRGSHPLWILHVGTIRALKGWRAEVSMALENYRRGGS